MISPAAKNHEILVLYYSRDGSVKQMADFVARGVESVANVQARIRTVPSVSPDSEQTAASVPDAGAPYVSKEDFKACAGLALGSPTRFGNMAAPMKHCIDQLGSLWLSHDTVGKVAGVFTSTGSLHGGQETTLLTMMMPLLHLGYLIVGVPYSEAALSRTTGGGTPYGPSHFAGSGPEPLPVTEDEKQVCLTLGKRLAETTARLRL